MTDTTPFDSPDVRGLRLVQAALRVSVSLACFGAVAAVLHQKVYPLTPMLVNIHGVSVAAAHTIEQVSAYVLIVCGLATLSRPMWPALLFTGVWFATASSVSLFEEGAAAAEMVPLEHAVRFLTPWALLLVDFFPPRLKFGLARFLASMIMLRVGIVATLATGGLRAIFDSRTGQGVTLIVATAGEKLLRHPLETETAAVATAIVGGISIGLALAISSGRPRGVGAAAIAWGVFTAFGWTIAHGSRGYHETLLRSCEWGAPLALLTFWLRGIEDGPGRMLAD